MTNIWSDGMLNIVVPMAGRGSRFAKEGYTDPKPLINILGRRMIEVVINNLKPRVPHRFIFICQQQHINDYNLKALLESASPGCAIIGIDGITDGAARTVMYAEELIDNADPLMIANSDQWVDIDINAYLSTLEAADADGLIMTMTANDSKWSYVEYNHRKEIIGVKEKEVVSDEATVGIYNFKHGADFCRLANLMFERGDKTNNEYYVAPIYTYLAAEMKKLAIYNVGTEADGMYGLGIPKDLELFLSLDVSKKAVSF
jgi:NDP-sugar pyrophosphorylase family protein